MPDTPQKQTQSLVNAHQPATPNAPSRKKIRKKFLRRASRRFCKGTPFQAPIKVVEAGLRSLEEWVDVLAEEREAHRAYLHSQPVGISRTKRKPKRAVNLSD